MDPVAWGPPLWSLLHAAAHRGRGVTDEAVVRGLRAMTACLPCCRCRSSLRRFLPAALELQLGDSFALTWVLHNCVNRKLGKPELPLDRARLRWRTAAVDPLAVLDALLITAYNFRQCNGRNKLQNYRALWAAAADMCGAVCTLREISEPLRKAASAASGAALAKATNGIRSALLKRRGCKSMCLADTAAAKYYALARAGSGRSD